MFSRDILADLQLWSVKPNRKPLVLRGARQVGKTSVVNEFGKRFDNYLYVNLERPNLRRIVEAEISEEDVINNLFAILGIEKKKGTILLFFDEIQSSPLTVQRLRYFYETMPSVHIIAAGSLLESLIDSHISFPVGRVEYMAMRPVSFREYLSAIGKNSLRQLILEKPEQSAILHNDLTALFNRYALIGGFPEVISTYMQNGDIVSLDSIYDTILAGYFDDVEKYARNDTQRQVIRYIIERGWQYAGEIITFNNFAYSNYKTREIGEAMRTLQKTMLLELAYPLSSSIYPIIPQQNRSPKLLWVDSGLVNFVSGIKKELLSQTNLLDTWKGRYAEHLVGQELLTLTNSVLSHRYYWSRPKATAEVDFVLPYEGMLVPIEVKAGNNTHLRSLHQYMETCQHDIAIRIWPNPYQRDEVITPNGKKFILYSLPFYLVGFIPEILSKH